MPTTPSAPAAALLARIDGLGLRETALEVRPLLWVNPDADGVLHTRDCRTHPVDFAATVSVLLLDYLEGPNAACCSNRTAGDARRESSTFWRLLELHDLLDTHAENLRAGPLDAETSREDRDTLMQRVTLVRNDLDAAPRATAHLNRAAEDVRAALAAALGAQGPVAALEGARTVIVPDRDMHPFLDWDESLTLIGCTHDMREPLPAVLADIVAAQGLRVDDGIYVMRTHAYVASYLMRVLPDQSVVMSTPAADRDVDALAASMWDPRTATPLSNLALAQASAAAIVAR